MGSCALSEPDDLGVYLIRACGFIPSFCPTPGYGFGGLIRQPDPPILSGLPLTYGDIRAHRTSLPPPHMVGSIGRLHLVSAGSPYIPCDISTYKNDTRPPYTRRTQSQTPPHPGYRMVTHSGFAAFDASASRSLHSSPRPRSACLGYTTSYRPALHNVPLTSPDHKPDSPPYAAPIPTPSEPKLYFPPHTVPLPTTTEHNPNPPLRVAPSHPAATDLTVEAAASGLSELLLNYGHRD